MAELLFKAVDATNPDSTRDALCYKRGDPVLVRDSGCQWGRLEVLPPAQGGQFCRIIVSDVTADRVREIVRNRWGIELDGEDEASGLRRGLQIKVGDLPPSVRSALNQIGVYTTTLTAIRSYIRRKSDGEAL